MSNIYDCWYKNVLPINFVIKNDKVEKYTVEKNKR